MKKSIYMQNVEREIKRQIKWSNFKTDLEMREFLVEIMEFCEKLFDKSLDREDK
jgi:hypothetical protein